MIKKTSLDLTKMQTNYYEVAKTSDSFKLKLNPKEWSLHALKKLQGQVIFQPKNKAYRVKHDLCNFQIVPPDWGNSVLYFSSFPLSPFSYLVNYLMRQVFFKQFCHIHFPDWGELQLFYAYPLGDGEKQVTAI